MKRIFEALKLNSNDSSTPQIVEEMLTVIYGSQMNGVSHLLKMRQNSINEDEFMAKLEHELFANEIAQIADIYTRFDSISSLIKYFSKIENSEIQEVIKTDRPKEFFAFLKKISPIFNKYDEDIPISQLNVKYSIKETREELGFKNQRTFKKWLTYFYRDKFDNRHYFSLEEYTDVFKKFFLKSDEEDFEGEKITNEYLTRIQQGLRFKKADLIKYSQNNYKILKNDINDIDSFKKLELPSDVDSYPFSIVDVIKRNLE